VKLLVATEFPPNATGGGPAIVRQMLKDSPAKRLFWWSCLAEHDQRFGQTVTHHFCAMIPSKLMPHRRYTQLKSAILDWVWRPFASTHLLRTIRRVQPDVVWVIPHNWSIYPLAGCLLNSRYAFHVSLHDYVDVHNSSQRFGRDRCALMAGFADELYAAATTRDAICQPMADDLMNRTGQAPDAIIHFGLEADQLENLQNAGRALETEGSTIRIAHAGTIHKDSVFDLLVRSLDQIRRRLRKRVQLDLYGTLSYQKRGWFDGDWMVEHGSLSEMELNAQLQQCTWGFSPMALDNSDPRYDLFSFPTKFIAYLAAGLPIITLGHAETSVAKMAAAYSVGLLSHSSDAENLSEELYHALDDPNPRERYRSEMIRCARTEFDAEQMRREIFTCFSVAASAKPRISHSPGSGDNSR
jgi:glycosyltransferase involved in cell wall biosynthesis